jgi:parvulin-like peptidyl-prolyl isomerase
VARRVFGIAALLLLTGALTSAQLIDRVLAVVAGEPITLSDVLGALRFGLVPQAPSKEGPTQAALNALVDRQLQLIEVNRYLPPEPTEAAMQERLGQIRARFTDEAAFEAALKETGLTVAQLRARVRDNLRIESYLLQRFGGGYQPSEEELLRFYRANDFSRGGAVRPYAEVRDEVRRRLIEARTESLVRDWIAGLRRRVDVTILPK